MEAEKQQNTQNIFMASVGREAKIETVTPKESYPKTLLNWEVNKIMIYRSTGLDVCSSAK